MSSSFDSMLMIRTLRTFLVRLPMQSLRRFHHLIAFLCVETYGVLKELSQSESGPAGGMCRYLPLGT